MYIPQPFEVTNIHHLHDFMETYNFATFVSQNDSGFDVSHLPTLLDRARGEKGTLVWHMAKQNSQASAFDGEREVLCIFHGPHGYISPTWYKTRPSVPTWNYAVVHAYGMPREISREELSQDLTNMIAFHEGKKSADPTYPVTEAYKNKLMDHIVGFHMKITRLQGKFKLGQNRSLGDQKGMLQGLRQENTLESLSLEKFIRMVQN